MNKIPLIENACKELIEYGVRDRREKCKALLKRLLLRRKTLGEDPIFWPTGLLAAGLWSCREHHVVAGRIDSSLAAYYERWLKKGTPIMYLDDLLAGETLLNMYQGVRERRENFGEKLSEEQMKCAADKLASYGAGHPTDEAGSFLYRPMNGETTVFVDGIGLSCPFLYRYGELFEKQEYKERAVLQIVNFLSYGMDGKTGLPYHGYDMTDGCKYGIIGWGRAVGWMLRGMMGCMISEYGRERLGGSCAELADATLTYQRQDGFFSWQLETLEGPADTSATGMICAALKQGLALGVFAGETYEKALTAGRHALERSVRDGRVYQCSGECEGFARYPQRYGAYPWSMGPALETLCFDMETFEE